MITEKILKRRRQNITNIMGDGIIVKCHKCDYFDEILGDYGGIYDWHTFMCKKCFYFTQIKTEHTEGKFLHIKYDETKKLSIKCPKCGSSKIKELNSNKYLFKFAIGSKLKILSKTKLKCPKCKKHMWCKGYVSFDD